MDEQPVPSASNCPYCGGTPEHDPNHVLSASGYTHDDIHFTCSECGEGWACGVPIGEADGELAQELFCDSCQERYMLPHRIQVRGNVPGIVVLHLKCPDEECYYFDTVRRETDGSGVMLYGYPQITGSVEDATRAYGYPEDHPDYDPDEV